MSSTRRIVAHIIDNKDEFGWPSDKQEFIAEDFGSGNAGIIYTLNKVKEYFEETCYEK